MVNFEGLAEEGVIAHDDLDLIHWSEDANEAWEFVQQFYRQRGDEQEEETVGDGS
jgi:predicted Rossmann-fold nucleotide-binding protein